jgi:hypothetical protein
MDNVMTNRNITTDNDTLVRKSAGYVMKRFKLSARANNKVFGHLRVLSGRWAAQGKPEVPMWEDALEDLLKTHPDLKQIKV